MLMRRAPLRRTGFARPSLPARSRPPVRALTRAAAPATFDLVAQPKTVYVRSERLRAAYRLIPCQHCGADDGTVCCAHANWAAFGKGGAIKASDDRAAALCAACHRELDQGRAWSAEQRLRIWCLAHVASVLLLVEIGEWPDSIPVPDMAPVFELIGG